MTDEPRAARGPRGLAAIFPLDGLWGDIRLASRRLLATPQFLLFSVVSLAIGIAVTTSVYSLLYALFWKPIGIAHPERAMFVTGVSAYGGATSRQMMSLPDFEDLRAAQTKFAALAATARRNPPLVSPAMTALADVEAVTGEYFAALGVKPGLGRTIQPQDDDHAAAVVVLNDRTWRTRFDADPAIVGRVVRLGGHPFEVIGVAEPAFDGIERIPSRTAAWVPLRAAAFFATLHPAAGDPRERRELTVIGRLAAAHTDANAAAEVATIGTRLDIAYPLHTLRPSDSSKVVSARRWSARPVTLPENGGPAVRLDALILGLVALVLVVACTNLANLMLARGAARQQELAVRRALGASRWRLVRELTVESAIVAALGGACALLLTRVFLVLLTIDVPIPRGSFAIEPQLNLPALAVASLALLLSMLVFGVEPALQLTRTAITGDLADGGGTLGAPRARRQRTFIRWQVAISATLFLIAAILAKVVVVESRTDSGVAVDRLAIATVHIAAQGWDEARARRTLASAADALRREPGIDSVSISSGVPFGMTFTSWATVTTPDRPFAPNRQYAMSDVLAATPEIFRTLGVPIVRGRAFDDRDDGAAPPVVVLSEKTARTMFGTADALGRQVVMQVWGRPPVQTFTVAGIARDTDSGRRGSRGNDTMYVPLAQHYEPNLLVIARTSGDPAAAARLIQKALRSADPDCGTGTVGPASLMMAGAYVAARMAALVAGALGLLTLILAMVGLYGVQAQIVARRVREIGVRMALGANPSQIHHMVLGQGFRPVVEGLILGAAFGMIARLGLRALIDPHIEVIDPVAFSLVPIPLFIAAFVACYVPAQRAARIDPNVALKHL